MKILIVYDSDYPNTKSIAMAIASGFVNQSTVAVKSVSEIDPNSVTEVETLIVGSASLGFKPSQKILDFLNRISKNSLLSVAVSAFDTRTPGRSLKQRIAALFTRKKGYASDYIDTILVKKGGIQVLPPEGFYSQGIKGRLYRNEQTRAMNWGSEIEILCPS